MKIIEHVKTFFTRPEFHEVAVPSAVGEIIHDPPLNPHLCLQPLETFVALLLLELGLGLLQFSLKALNLQMVLSGVAHETRSELQQCEWFAAV